MQNSMTPYQPGSNLDSTTALLIGMKQKGTLQSYVAAHRGTPEYPTLLALATSINNVSAASEAAKYQPPAQTVSDQRLASLAPAQQAASQALPENQGIGQLPAPNLETVGKAAGGIIAFNDGGEVQHFREKGYVESASGIRYRDEETAEETPLTVPMTPEEYRAFMAKTHPGAAAYAANAPVYGAANKTTATAPTLTPIKGGDEPLRMTTETDPRVAAMRATLSASKADTGKTKVDEGIAKLISAKPSADKDAAPAEKGLGSIAEFAKEANAYTGDDPTAKQLERIEKQEASAAGEKKDAFNMALLKAGLGMMSGTSQYAFENIGKGAMGGLEDYASAMKDLKKAALERDKMRDAAEQAAYAYKRDDVKGYRTAKEKEADRRTEMEKAQLAASTTIQAANIGRSATLAAAQLPPKEAQMAAMLGTGKTFEERFQSGLPKLTAIQAGKFDPRKAYTEYLVAAQRSGTGDIMPFAEFAMQFAPRVSGGGAGTVLPRKD